MIKLFNKYFYKFIILKEDFDFLIIFKYLNINIIFKIHNFVKLK